MLDDATLKEHIDYFGNWFLEDEKIPVQESYTALFEPIFINRLKLKNRIVMGPMGNVGMADESGKPSEKMIAYYLERAKGGAGLITSGMVPVDSYEDPSFSETGGVSIFPQMGGRRSNYVGWRTIAENCHAYGARFFVQLAPGMGRVGNPECLTKKYKMPISSSWHRNWYINEVPCRPISDFKINRIIEKTAQLAADCKAMAVDGVYLHGHSGYFIEQMTDPAYNKRKLGKYRHYQRFGVDLVEKIRARVGVDYPIYYRINLSAGFKATFGEKMEQVPYLRRLQNERTIEQTLAYMAELVKAGVDMFDVDLGGYENWWLPHPPNGMPPGAYLPVAACVKAYFEKHNVVSHRGVPVPVVAVGKLGNPDLAEAALKKGQCDLIMLSRPLLADPYWPKKVESGQVADICPCIGDHEGCLAQLALGGHPHCAVNPRTAFESSFGPMVKAEVKKKIAIVGAGPAGCMAAITLNDRGHDVTLLDSNESAGGMLLLGGVPKIKFEIQHYIHYLNHQLNQRMIRKVYKMKADVSVLKSGEYDIIVLATGSKPFAPKLPGADQPHVVMATEFLSRPNLYKGHKDYVVVGGSDVGCEIAHMIAYEWQSKVSVLEMGKAFMQKTCTSNRGYMLYHLEKAGVLLFNCCKVMSIGKTDVLAEQLVSKAVPNPYLTWTPILPENIKNPFERKLPQAAAEISIPAGLVILATGATPKDDLYQSLCKERVAKEVYAIGDAFEPGRVLEAVKAGYHLGRTL